MNIGLFGGTFDPIHRGHLALARAARERFRLARIYFVPASRPPHKQQPVASFSHRYAMVALATAGEKGFVPSLLEESGSQPRANYSIDTVRRLKRALNKSDRLFFLIGMDAFRDIAQWREAEALFQECEFIVASRPGYSLADVAKALPESLRPAASGTVHLLEGVHQPMSATAIRAAGKPLAQLVGPAVAEYIKKQGLYQR